MKRNFPSGIKGCHEGGKSPLHPAWGSPDIHFEGNGSVPHYSSSADAAIVSASAKFSAAVKAWIKEPVSCKSPFEIKHVS